jgi:hypothetical protein
MILYSKTEQDNILTEKLKKIVQEEIAINKKSPPTPC